MNVKNRSKPSPSFPLRSVTNVLKKATRPKLTVSSDVVRSFECIESPSSIRFVILET